MRISFDCEQCGTNYKVDAARAGQSAKCRHCGAMIRVPVPAPPPEVSESGAPILRHAERTKPFELAIGDIEHIEAIVAHVERHIGEVGMVFHEIVSDLIHVDVHHILPAPDRDFHTLFTTGMSDKPMTVPEGADDFRFAELVVCLPASWKLTQEDFADEANYWPIRLMKDLARLPHEYDTWLGPGHSVPNGEVPQPYAPNTRFSCALIVPAFQFGQEFWQAEMPDGRTVNFYSVWPLLPDETDFKLREGYDKLMDRLLEHGVTDVIDVGRRSAVTRGWWPFGR
jgi:hypothetical protein